MKFINHEIENGHSMIDVLIVEIRLTIWTITLEKYRLIITRQTTLIVLYIISRYEMYTVYMYDNTHIRESRL